MIFIIFFIFVYIANLCFLIHYRKHISINNIGFLFLIYWLINIPIGLLLFHDVINWNYNALSYMLICVDFFALSTSYINTTSIEIDCSEKEFLFKTKNVYYILFFGFLAGLGYVYLELSLNGFSMSNLTSMQGLEEAGYYYTDGRYGGTTEIKTTTLEQILLTINYATFALAGFVYCFNNISKYLCFIQFLPMIASTLSTTAKTLLISGLFLWICGYLVATIYLRKNLKVSIRILFTRLLLPIFVCLALFYLSFSIRYQSNDSEAIINRIFVYMFGHVPCYDDWFDKFDANLFGYSYGQQSVGFLFGNHFPLELKAKYVVPSLTTPNGWTNVNTMFAYVLMDFGYLGSFLFWLLLGKIAMVAKKAVRHARIWGFGVLGLCFYIVIYSFLISPMKYLSIVGGFFLFSIMLFTIKLKRISYEL